MKKKAKIYDTQKEWDKYWKNEKILNILSILYLVVCLAMIIGIIAFAVIS